MNHASTLATFIVDPFVPMLLVGLLLGGLTRLKWGSLSLATRFRVSLVALAAFVVGFIVFAEIPCYFDHAGSLPPWIDAQTTCNEFMWKGYGLQFWFDVEIPTYAKWWSTPWLLLNFAVQSAVAYVSFALMVRARFTSEKNLDGWTKPVRELEKRD